MGFSPCYSPGDWVIYRKTKFGRTPGTRARNVSPTRNGDGYTYNVDKLWVVVSVLDGGLLRVITRRGKEHIVSDRDPNLHRATWLERLRYRQRFEEVARLQTSVDVPIAQTGTRVDTSSTL